jgi:choline monooxygenase
VRDAGRTSTTIGDEPVLVVRGNDGVLRAMTNVCRHRRADREERGQASVLQCGYHGWTYSLDGRLKLRPSSRACRTRSSELRAAAVQVEVWNELVFVNLDRAESLTDFLGELLQDMPPYDYSGFRLAHHKTWGSTATGRSTSTTISRGTTSRSSTRRCSASSISEVYGREAQLSFRSRRRAGRNAFAAMDVRYFWIFPNLMLNVYPDNFSTDLILPIGPHRTATLFDVLQDRTP